MKDTLKALLIVIAVFLVAAVPGPPSTAFTRGFLRVADATEAQAYLGVSGSGPGTTNYFDFTVITNNFFVSGKGNSLVITQTLQVSGHYVYPIAAGSGITLTTNNIGTGQTNITIAATGGGGGASVWVPNTALTYISGGTNVAIDGSGGTNFYLTVTKSTWMTTPSNIPADKGTNTSFTVFFKMDSSGAWPVGWTNANFKFPGGPTAAFQPDTNANAVSWVSFTMSPFTNGIFMGDYGVLGVQ